MLARIAVGDGVGEPVVQRQLVDEQAAELEELVDGGLANLPVVYDAATMNDGGTRTMTRDLPRTARKPRRKALWMRDWLPDRVTTDAPAAQPAANTTATAVAERDGPRDRGGGRRRPRPAAGARQLRRSTPATTKAAPDRVRPSCCPGSVRVLPAWDPG